MSLLKKAVEEDKVDALEADICWNEVFNVPVMKHARTSQEPSLSNECLVSDWIKVALYASVRIVKLDFKSLLAVPVVLDLIQAELDKSPTSVQILLNADILPGPGYSGLEDHGKELNAGEFLFYCKRMPQASLSLGWTTTNVYPWTLQIPTYEHVHVQKMIHLLKEQGLAGAEQHVTFPIRASFAYQSWRELTRLLSELQNTSITLWTGEEGVPQTELDYCVNSNPEIIFVDCDKGPRHPYYHPARLWHYLNLLVFGW